MEEFSGRAVDGGTVSMQLHFMQGLQRVNSVPDLQSLAFHRPLADVIGHLVPQMSRLGSAYRSKQDLTNSESLANSEGTCIVH